VEIAPALPWRWWVIRSRRPSSSASANTTYWALTDGAVTAISTTPSTPKALAEWESDDDELIKTLLEIQESIKS